VSLLACHLAGDLGYAAHGETTGVFRADAPYPVTIDLTNLA
jgi:hypothetical protein